MGKSYHRVKTFGSSIGRPLTCLCYHLDMTEKLERAGVPIDSPMVPVQEMVRISNEQSREQEWWAKYSDVQTPADIEVAIASGRATRVPDAGAGYRLSPGVKAEFKALDTRALNVLNAVAAEWLSRVRRKDISTDDLYLRITSLARTVEYQRELADRGYPAVECSTHSKLGAFDILSSWFEKNRPDLLAELDAVLEEYKTGDRINWIREPDVGVYHIALNPAASN